jgi:hypothetical protein
MDSPELLNSARHQGRVDPGHAAFGRIIAIAIEQVPTAYPVLNNTRVLILPPTAPSNKNLR